ALHPDHVADPDNVFGAVDAEIGEFADVDHSVLAGKHFDEAAKLLDRDDAALIGLTDFDLLGHAHDDLLRAIEAVGAVAVDVHRAVVLDVNFRSGLGDDAFDRLAAGPDD